MSQMAAIFRISIFLLFLLFFLNGLLFSQETVTGTPCIENMTTDERDNLKIVAEGKLIFNTSTGCLNYYTNKKWRSFCETAEEPRPPVDFDEQSGKLTYQINGQLYTFSLESKELYIDPTQNLNNDTDPGVNISTSDLPDDCRKKPTRPYAGRDLVSFDQVDLEGNKPLHGVGFWQVISGDSGQFVDSTVPATQFIGAQGITYTLRWTIATKCDTLFDDALVRIRPPCAPEPSQSFAGSDQFNVEEATLGANFPRSGKGIWTIVSGLGGFLSDPSNPKTKFKGRPGETYVLRWMIRTECGLTQDDIIVKIKPPCSPVPSQAYAGEDQIEVDKCKLNAENPIAGKGKWQILEGEKGKIFNADTNTTTFYGRPGEIYVLQWTVSSKCGSNSDEVTIKFASYCPEEFTDFRDGKKYKGVRLAGQCWMAENLKYRAEGLQSFCYDGYTDFCEQYGALYSWNIAMQGEEKESSRGICPEGWHLPSDDEWQRLIDSSGFNGIELQMNGKSDFNIPMGGARYTNGKFLNIREYAYYWSSTQKDEKTAWNRYFPFKSATVDHFPTDKRHSFSVRCIKDN